MFLVELGSGVRERVQRLGNTKEERGAGEGRETRSNGPEAVGRKLYPVHGVIRLVNQLSGRDEREGQKRARTQTKEGKRQWQSCSEPSNLGTGGNQGICTVGSTGRSLDHGCRIQTGKANCWKMSQQAFFSDLVVA